MGKVLPLGWVR